MKNCPTAGRVTIQKHIKMLRKPSQCGKCWVDGLPTDLYFYTKAFTKGRFYMLETKLKGSNACEVLKSCVQLLKKKYPKFSSKQLAKHLKIPSSTFGRIENQEITTPKFSHALNIIQSVCEEGDIHKFISKYYSQMASVFENVYSGNSKVKFVPLNCEPYFTNSTTYKIMLFVTSGVFVTAANIKEKFGSDGLKIVQDLLDKKILIKQGDEILLVKETLNTSQETGQKLLQNLVTFNYDVSKFGEASNWLSVQYKAVDKTKVMPRLVEILKEANQKIREVLQSQNNEGSDVVWAGMAMDTLFQDQSDLNKKEVLQ